MAKNRATVELGSQFLRERKRGRESELGWSGLKRVGDFGYIDA